MIFSNATPRSLVESYQHITDDCRFNLKLPLIRGNQLKRKQNQNRTLIIKYYYWTFTVSAHVITFLTVFCRIHWKEIYLSHNPYVDNISSESSESFVWNTCIRTGISSRTHKPILIWNFRPYKCCCYFYIYCLFIDAINKWYYIASNGRTIVNTRLKRAWKKHSWTNMRKYAGIPQEGLRRTMRKHSSCC